jgi:hypothetical protein
LALSLVWDFRRIKRKGEIMYKLSIPFMLDQIDKYGAQSFIDELKKMNADIVFLALDCYQMDKNKQEKISFIY